MSPAAVQEMTTKVPAKFDRTDAIFRTNIARIMPNSGFLKFHEVGKTSRDHISRSIQFNRASKYLPLIFAEVREAAKKW